MPTRKHRRHRRRYNRERSSACQQPVPSCVSCPAQPQQQPSLSCVPCQQPPPPPCSQPARGVVFLASGPPPVPQPCLVCLVNASYEVLPDLRRKLLQCADEVEHFVQFSETARREDFLDLVFGLVFGLAIVTLIVSAVVATYGLSTIASVGLAFFAAVSVLLLVRKVPRAPMAATPLSILGEDRLAELENTWEMFCRGRSAMNEVRFGRASSTPSPPSPSTDSRPSVDWCVRLGDTLSDILFTEDEEVENLNLRLNDAICGATMADVIDASIQCQQSREGTDGDLLRDFAEVCQMIQNGEL